MEVTDDMLMALADGELDRATAARLQALVAGDPALQRRLALFVDSAAALRAAMDPGPTPDRLVDAILSAPVAAPMAAGGTVVPLPRRSPRAMALAATLAALAFGLGGYLLGQARAPGSADLSAYATLATGSAQTLPDGRMLRALGSYDTDQGLCRMLSLQDDHLSERQILCRNGTGWQMALTLQTPGSDGFLPASDVLSGAADLWLDTMGAGPALDPAAEAAALAGG